jgi:hypothetical protein
MLKGTVYENSKRTTGDFQTHFKSISDPRSMRMSYILTREELNVMFSELNVPCTGTEIFNTCKQLNTGKSAGSDDLLNRLLSLI